jgi:hypothetical protein
VVWRGGEARGQKGRLTPYFLGGLRSIEKEGACSYIKKKERSGALNSHTPMKRELVAIQRRERRVEDLRMDNTKGQN